MIILKLVFWYEIMLTRLYSKYSNARGLMVAILYRTPSAALIWGLLPSDHSAINTPSQLLIRRSSPGF